MKKRIFGFDRNVFFLSLTSFLTDVSSEIIYPMLPIFLTSVLKAGTAFVGIVEGVAETTASFLKLFSGWFSDRIRKRKALVVIGYTLSSVTRPLMALAVAPWNVLAIRFTDRVGKGVRNSPRDALIADSCDPNERGRSFGFNRAMDNAGAMVGSLIVFFLLLGVTGNLRHIFALAAVPAVLAVIVVVFFTYEVAPAQAAQRPAARFDAGIMRNTKLRPFLLSVFIFTLGNSSDAFLLLRARERGVGLAFIPLLWFVLHVVKTVSSTPAGVLSDRIGRRRVIIAGWLIYAAVYCGFAFAQGALHVWLLFAVYGLFYGLTEGVERALVADMVSQDERGGAFGVYNFAVGIGALPASLLMGILWQAFGPHAAFLVGASFALAASVMLVLFVRS